VADNDQSDRGGRDPEGRSREAHPGGSPSRGPNADPGGEVEPGGLVAPYDDRSKGGDPSGGGASVSRQMESTKTANDGATASPADEQPVTDDQMTAGEPETPLGVGESISRRGEDMSDDDGKEAGRHDMGTKGESGRPVGMSDERDQSGVDPGGTRGG